MTVQTLAAALYDALICDKRTDGAEFVKLVDGAPEWMTEAIHAAHGDMMPDDWRYKAIRRVAVEISESDDLEDAEFDRCDAMVDIYNSRLCEWLASHVSRIGYCDEAAEEFGFDKDRGIIGLMQVGQLAEYRDIWGALVSALEEQAENEPKAWMAGWNMPGYMPDSEPCGFDTAEEARDYIRDEIKRAADELEGDAELIAEHDSALESLDSLDGDSEFGRQAGRYHYWASRA